MAFWTVGAGLQIDPQYTKADVLWQKLRDGGALEARE